MNISLRQNIEIVQKTIDIQEGLRSIAGSDIVDSTITILQKELTILESALLTTDTTQQRKNVTILFADIAGFTSLSEKLDVEDVQSMIDVLWGKIDAIIIQSGGWIDKHIGDAIMAVWGVNIAREDDPERAVRAALDMQKCLVEMHEFATGTLAEIFALTGPLHIRVGIHTGPVLLCKVGLTREFTAMGDAVNTASRLEQSAPLDGVVISSAIYHQIRGAFDINDLGTIQLKGKSEPVQLYQVIATRQKKFKSLSRGLEGIETYMIGRNKELDLLCETYIKCINENKLQYITISGEPGLGKSRLIYEFLLWLEENSEANIFNGRADEETYHSPYALLQDIFNNSFNLQESDTISEIEYKMVDGISKYSPEQSELRAHFISKLIGFEFINSHFLQDVINDANQLRNRALNYLIEYFRSASAKTPIVILLDDIHWSDSSTLHVLPQIINALSDEKVLFICATRPVLLKTQFESALHIPDRKTIELLPLSQSEIKLLAEEILRFMTDIPQSLIDMIITNSEGNPFYVEELIKMLIDNHVISITNENQTIQWVIDTKKMHNLKVPQTLTGILQARFDNLPVEEKLSLQRAAVIGRTFWDRALDYVQEKTQDPLIQKIDIQNHSIMKTLESLSTREMISFNLESSVEGSSEFIFKHALMRTAIYESILKNVRRRYHALIADWLIENSYSRKSDRNALIAEHLSYTERNKETISYFRLAGEKAASKAALQESIQYFDKALSLLPAHDIKTRFEIMCQKESLYNLEGKRTNQSELLPVLRKLSEELGDSDAKAHIALRQARFTQQTSDYKNALHFAKEAYSFALQSGNKEIEASGLLESGRVYYRQANYAEARKDMDDALKASSGIPAVSAEILQSIIIVVLYQGETVALENYIKQALEEIRKAGNRQIEANVLLSIGTSIVEHGNDETAKTYLVKALELYKEIADQRGLAQTLQQLGFSEDKKGFLDFAEPYYHQALEIYHSIGDLIGEGWMQNTLGSIRQKQGFLDKAISYFDEGLHIYQKINVPWGEAIALHNLGRIEMLIGQFDKSRDYFNKALQICLDSKDLWGACWRYSYLGLLEHQTENNEKARTLTQSALDIALQFNAEHEIAMTLTHNAHVLFSLNDIEGARQGYLKAIELRKALGEHHLELESLAGLIRVELLENNFISAIKHTDTILDFLKDPDSLDATDEPLHIFKTCIKALKTVKDSRLNQTITLTEHWVQTHSMRLQNSEVRKSFLQTNEIM